MSNTATIARPTNNFGSLAFLREVATAEGVKFTTKTNRVALIDAILSAREVRRANA